MHVDPRAHPVQLRHVHEAVLEDRLGDHGGALGHRHQRHELRLHVGREAGIRFGHRVGAMQAVQALHHQPARFLQDLHAGFTQRAHGGPEMLQPRVAQEHRPAGDRRGTGVRPGLYPVRNDTMRRAAQPFHALDRQLVGADPADPRAHLHQTRGEVDNLRLPRRVRQHGLTVGQRGGHQQLLGRADGDEREHDRRPAQPPGHTAINITAIQVEGGAQLLQPLQMQVDRAGADRAAAGQRHPRLPHPRQQRAQNQHRGAHLAHDVVRRLGIGDGAADRQRPPVVADWVHRDAVLGQQRGHRVDVGELWHVGQDHPVLGQQTGGHQRQRRVLGPADLDFPRQRPAAADSNSVHSDYILGLITSGEARCRAVPCISRISRHSWSRKVRYPARTETGRSPRSRESARARGSCC